MLHVADDYLDAIMQLKRQQANLVQSGLCVNKAQIALSSKEAYKERC